MNLETYMCNIPYSFTLGYLQKQCIQSRRQLIVPQIVYLPQSVL